MTLAVLQRLSYSLRQPTFFKEKNLGKAVKNKVGFNKCIFNDSSQRAIATLSIKPKVSLVDEPIQTVIGGLGPHQQGKSARP